MSGSTKIQIVPAQPKTLSHLPSRPAVELAFRDLAYRVREGRSNSKYSHSCVITWEITCESLSENPLLVIVDVKSHVNQDVNLA